MGSGVIFIFALVFIASIANVFAGNPAVLRVVGESKSRAVYGRCYLSASDADLLACLDVSSGSLTWRFPIDETSRRNGKKVVAGDKLAFVLSYSTTAQDATVYAVSVKDGALMWKLPLSSSGLLGDAVDMTYSRSDSSVYVLLHNAVHKIASISNEPSVSTMQIDDSVLPGLNLLRLIDSVEENPATKRGVAIGCIRSKDGNCDESAILQLNTQNGDSVEVTKMKSSSKSEQVFASGSAVYRVDTDFNDARSLKVALEQTSYGGTQHQSSLNIDLTSLVGADDAMKIVESQFYLVDNVPVIHLQAVVARNGEPSVRLHFVVGGIEDGKLTSIYVPHSAEEKALVAVDSIASSSRSIRQLHVYVNDAKASTHSLLDGKIRVTHGFHHIHLGDSMVGLIKESEKVIVAEGGSRIAAFDVTSSSLAHLWTRHEALSRLQQAILLPGTTMKTSSSFFGALDAICAQSQFAYAKPLCAIFDSSKVFLDSLETAMQRILPSHGSHHRHHRGDALVSGQDHVIALSYSGDAVELLTHPRPLDELNVQVHSLVFPHDLPALSELNGGKVEKSVLISSRRLVASRRSSSSGSLLVRSLRLLQVPSSAAEVDDGSVSVRILADIVDGGVVSWMTTFSLEEDMRARNGDEYTSVISSSLPVVQTVLSSEELKVSGNVLAVMPTHIVAAAENEGASVAIVPLTDKHHHKVPAKTPQFVHTISTSTGEISIFDSKTTRQVSSVQFDPAVEEIVNVAFPLSNDLIYSRVVILGDDNILVKYLNPNMVAVCTAATQGRDDGNATVTPQVFVNLLDIVSGNVLQRVVIDSAAAPVRAHLMENFVLVSYWNPVVKRAEIITMGLYDGVIGKTDYLPFASKPSVGTREHDEKTTSKAAVGHEVSSSEDDEKTILLRSSFLTSIPLVMQRTYLMPRKVMDITHTLSRHGLTNKNILLTMESGEVYNLDFRLLHPRRPVSEPTAAEKEEGLMRYGPIFPLMPQSTVTMEQGLRPTSRYPTQTLSAPSYLESEALIFIYGCFNDVLFTSVTPSQGFDTLSANFNYTALVGLITLLFVGVMILRRMHRRTTLKRMWQ